MNLHSAGHRRGVVCAPHYAAVEAGRAILAEGGNAIEAMVAMAAAIAAVYPHMNHLGGDGFWLIREPSGRVRAIMAAGPAGVEARPELYRELRDDPAARAARGAHRAGRGRRLDAGARSREGRTAAGCRSTSCSPPPSATPATATRCRAARRGSPRSTSPSSRRAGFRRDVSDRRQGAGRRHDDDGRRRSPRRSRISPMPVSTISIAAMSGARSRPISSASAVRSRAKI